MHKLAGNRAQIGRGDWEEGEKIDEHLFAIGPWPAAALREAGMARGGSTVGGHGEGRPCLATAGVAAPIPMLALAITLAIRGCAVHQELDPGAMQPTRSSSQRSSRPVELSPPLLAAAGPRRPAPEGVGAPPRLPGGGSRGSTPPHLLAELLQRRRSPSSRCPAARFGPDANRQERHGDNEEQADPCCRPGMGASEALLLAAEQEDGGGRIEERESSDIRDFDEEERNAWCGDWAAQLGHLPPEAHKQQRWLPN
nr:unnamed protein product [Digitaria exilis]